MSSLIFSHFMNPNNMKELTQEDRLANISEGLDQILDNLNGIRDNANTGELARLVSVAITDTEKLQAWIEFYILPLIVGESESSEDNYN